MSVREARARRVLDLVQAKQTLETTQPRVKRVMSKSVKDQQQNLNKKRGEQSK